MAEIWVWYVWQGKVTVHSWHGKWQMDPKSFYLNWIANPMHTGSTQLTDTLRNSATLLTLPHSWNTPFQASVTPFSPGFIQLNLLDAPFQIPLRICPTFPNLWMSINVCLQPRVFLPISRFANSTTFLISLLGCLLDTSNLPSAKLNS